MKLPVSLLVLAVVGQAASKIISEKSSSNPTIKRELREGIYGELRGRNYDDFQERNYDDLQERNYDELRDENYGERRGSKYVELRRGRYGEKIQYLNKYDKYGSETTRGVEYGDDSKQEERNSEPTHSLIQDYYRGRFGPIPKISDLLTGEGLGSPSSFDVALSGHLYSPVSAYNTRASNPFEIPAAVASNHNYPDPKFFEQLRVSSTTQSPPKQESEEDINLNNRASQNDRPQNTELYSFSKSKQGSNSFVHPTLDFNSDYFQNLFQRQNTFPNAGISQLFSVPPPQKSFKFQFPSSAQYPLPSHTTQLFPYNPVNHKSNHEDNSEEENQRSNEQHFQRDYEKRPEAIEAVAIPSHAYHAHPNGAVSYASYTHNQGLSKFQPENQFQYKQPLNFQPESEFQYNKPLKIQQESSDQQPLYRTNDPQELYVQLQQQEYLGRPFNEQLTQNKQHGVVQTIAVPQTLQNQLYLNPIRQQLFHDIQHQHPGSAHQPFDYHQQSPFILPTFGPKYFGQPQTNSPFTQYVTQPLPASEQLRYPEQPTRLDNRENSRLNVNLLPATHYTPQPTAVTYRHTLKQLKSSTTLVPPTSQNIADQHVRPTTVKPKTFNKTAKDVLRQSKSLNQATSTEPPFQQTVIPLLTSPVTLQSLSTFVPSSSSTLRPDITPHTEKSLTTPIHSVQVLKQELQEIHTGLESEVKPQEETQQEEESKEHEYRVLNETPVENQDLSTPLPTETLDPDHEIEIASNIDPKQLPVDLRPIPSGEEESQPQAAEQTESQTEQYQEPQHSETQNLQQEQNQLQEQSHQQQVEQNQQQLQQNQQQLEQNQQQLELNQQQIQQNQHHQLQFVPHNHFNYGQLNRQHNIPPFGPNTNAFYVTPQPNLHPELFSNNQELVLQPDYRQLQPQVPTIPPVQYFGKFPENIFRGFQRLS